MRCWVYTPEFVGIEEIYAGDGGSAEYFNLHGQRVEHPASGTIVIHRSGGKAEK